MTRKVKLRDLTEEQYNERIKNHCKDYGKIMATNVRGVLFLKLNAITVNLMIYGLKIKIYIVINF